MSEVLPRITEIINWSALGPAGFADEIGINRAVVSHILSARNKASLEVVQKILNRFSEVSPSWLLLGEGEMLKHLASNASDPVHSEKSKSQEKLTVENTRSEKMKVQDLPLNDGKVEGISEGRRLVKIVMFYSDGKFEQYDPS